MKITIVIEYWGKYREKISYLIVGVWNTIFGFGLFSFLYFLLSNILSYGIILAISYVISVTNAFYLYKYFVFKSKGSIWKEYIKFSSVYLNIYLINLCLLYLLNLIAFNNIYYGQAISVSIIMLISYFSHKKFTFKKVL